ncbi:FlhC family transcriptional regulator [Janthinobacterium sp. 1_2014MBL_MicDiv]|uniref:FlhC family transcriptional regulator n=1 Tax=Janthinobacterium sp. 1_2014MBL_MicDiv TaxID=1644131 RepID=UPI0009F4C12B|nr:FlhC family transcriptional regulator [Janthinobacterium sp. 1_2014MBL_MicDiv]
MAYEHAERHIQALQLAKSCVEHGARMKTVTYLTGLSGSLLREYFYNDRPATGGRWPSSQDWYHMATLVQRAEASLIATIFQFLRTQHGCSARKAMVYAYKMYRERWNGRSSISFDRAFELIASVEGIWTQHSAQLALHTCARCRCRYLIALGDTSADHSGCVFCKLVKRFATDSRIQSSFAGKPDLRLAVKQN